MASYGWTLDQALDITLPQTNLLFRAMANNPPPVVALAAILGRAKKDGEPDGALSALGGAGVVESADVQQMLAGIKKEGGAARG